MNAFFSFSNCLRHAFFTGAGYGDLERISGNAFCYAIHRGAYLMVLRVVKWWEIPE